MRNPAHTTKHLHACIEICTADCPSVLDLGCGVGDKLALCRGPILHGVDIHLPHIRFARTHWRKPMLLEVADMEMFARQAARRKVEWDAVMLIDSLEHIAKERGLALLEHCKKIARRRLIVFVPEGHQPQNDTELCGLGGKVWQQHRADWNFLDLADREFDVCRWWNMHGTGRHALFALWKKHP